MNDDRFDERLREMARDYHRPPETPRDEMWAAIVAERRRRAEPRVFVLRPVWRWGLAMAAVLLLGVALGWWIRPQPRGGVGAPAVASAGTDVPYQVAAAQYLNRTETLLAGFRADARAGRVDTLFVAQARELLSSTRLLLLSPAGRDPRLKPLLEDLELVLAQIALLPRGRDTEDVNLITQGMDQQSVLTRLRTAIPVGPASAPRTQGAL